MIRIVALVFAGVLAVAPLRAQQGSKETQTVELRVASQRPRGVLVDRGSVDGLAVGDRVRFLRRTGGEAVGRVVELGERNALVALDDPNAQVELGTRGEVRVPVSRLAPEVPRIAPNPETAETAPDLPEHPAWKNDDEAWQDGEPLLAHVVPLRPDERAPSLSGRVWSSADEITSSEDDRTDGFERLGMSLRADNRFGRGESIGVDLELNARRTDVPDNDDESETHLRIDRASYAIGNSRFAVDRFEFGRFLQRGLPEFGVLDGVEWGRRLTGGDRVGASVGYMPEPDQDFESGHDFQAAAYYRWVFDESEVFSASAGVQKTIHHGDSDRDLAIAKVEYFPNDGWSANLTTWIDYYTSGDQAKGPGVDITQAYGRVAHRDDDGNSLGFVYTHLSIPEIDRNDVPQLTAAALADDRNDRFAAEWDRGLAEDLRLRVVAGLWSDEFESGSDAELAVRRSKLWSDAGRGELSLFGTRGRFSRTYGARARYAREDEFGAWTCDYEFAQNTIDEFASDNNELPQHRLRVGRDWHSSGGWSFACDIEAWLWDQETAFALHLYLQRSF
ncbi:MAG: hypothetical protein K8S98_01635 [Planctomycetes bacterium]|nr:hypothetical protein [Planctomycetota bacterium]